MNRSTFILAFAASVALTAFSFIHAQESSETKRTFLLRAIPEPVDPDPTSQTAAARTATLRKRMQEAKLLFETGKVQQCLNEYVDPFWLARAAASSELTIDQLLDKQILGDKQRADGLATAFAKTIESNLETEPTWLLEGRVASFITKHSSLTAEFWIYFEGKWRISPES